MKANIEVSQQSGIFFYWTLVLKNKNESKYFFLGQDVKVCIRLLGMPPKVVVERIGTNNITSPEGNKNLTELILEHLIPDGEEVTSLFNHPEWMFAVE